MQRADPREDATWDIAVGVGFNPSSFQSIADLLSPERVRIHLRTLAELLDAAILSESDPDQARGAVHKLISVSASLGFERVSLSCQRIERAYFEGTSFADAHFQLRQAAEAARPVIEMLRTCP
jgi:hypothetical protein